METWSIGAALVSRIVEMVLPIKPQFLIPDATPENLAPMESWLKPHFLLEGHRIPLSIHTFLIEVDGLRILVDTCIGNDKTRDEPAWNARQGDFLEQLAARGAPAETIDFVLCTHLHVDHVGWNTRLVNGHWVPTFTNARYLFGRTEWDFWAHETDPFGHQARGDSIEPIIAGGRADFVETDHQLCPSVRLVPTPGHTPGHVSVLIESGDARAIITGDLFHHPCQFARPQWPDSADVDTVQAAQTRAQFMSRFSDGTLVLGTHFASPTAGHVVADGAGYRFRV